ncbi:MAG: BlaI/MecI/CopY family transcriptional regulator [Acidobacteria bacterium]|nr:BlaI/MecI/CopY family transcriptional regulator [Acidobacteriota bacterium]MBV9475529.1 BlaI/MecI/CopY family transcriptional regulator [Acidobacteriota bacterium]
MQRPTGQLSRREREMMDIVFRSGRATAGEVQEAMQDAPTYSAVRATLRILEQKGLLRHETDGNRYVYRPAVNRDRERRGALHHLLDTFFDGSIANVVATLLEKPGKKLDDDELQRIERLIADARKEGR